MVEASHGTASLTDQVVEAYFGLLRPQGPPPSWPGLDLTMGQLRLLFRLRHEGAATMGAIAHVSECSLQSATALVERVERRGLVVRERRDGDRRVVECQLTPFGRGLVDELAGHRAATLRTGLALLDARELAELHRLLMAMIERQAGPAHHQGSTRSATPRGARA